MKDSVVQLKSETYNETSQRIMLLQACEAVWSNCKQMQSGAIFFSCVTNMNCCITCFTRYSANTPGRNYLVWQLQVHLQEESQTSGGLLVWPSPKAQFSLFHLQSEMFKSMMLQYVNFTVKIACQFEGKGKWETHLGGFDRFDRFDWFRSQLNRFTDRLGGSWGWGCGSDWGCSGGRLCGRNWRWSWSCGQIHSKNNMNGVLASHYIAQVFWVS